LGDCPGTLDENTDRGGIALAALATGPSVKVRLRVRSREEKKGKESKLLWEKEFRVTKEGDKLRLEQGCITCTTL